MKQPTTLPVELIAYHPMLESLPGLWADSSPEMAGLVEDVEAHGIHEPLIVVQGFSEETIFLIDGRHRLRAAQMAGLESVPVVFREEADAADIILSTLVHRRHYLKGALAYLSYPIVSEKLKGRGGNGSNQHRIKEQLPIQSALPTLDSVAATLGLSSDTLLQARGVHDMFRRSPSLRAEYEPRILAGEIGLGACLAGLRSKESTEGGSRKPATYLAFDSHGNLHGLLPKSLVTISNGFETWGDLDPEARALFRQQFIALLDKAPQELASSIRGGKKS